MIQLYQSPPVHTFTENFKYVLTMQYEMNKISWETKHISIESKGEN